jgi:hypothetical protein
MATPASAEAVAKRPECFKNVRREGESLRDLGSDVVIVIPSIKWLEFK